MFSHIFNDVLHSDVDSVFDNALVQVSDDVLDHSELLEELSPCIKDLVRKDVLLTIDPEVRESFLSWVKNLCQIA